jgi:hypothetical protein
MNHTHPLRERADLSLEQRLETYREACAQLMDFVWWWVKLTDAERQAYREQGFPDLTLDL